MPTRQVLHTSDWHLGRSLHKNKRYDEFEAFLDVIYHIYLGTLNHIFPLHIPE